MDWKLFFSIFLSNREIFFQFLDLIDETLFKSAVPANLFILAKRFTAKYKRPPDLDTLSILLDRLPEVELKHKQLYVDFINDTAKLHPSIDTEVFKGEFYRILQNHEMEKFIIKTAGSIGSVSFEKVLGDIRGMMTKFHPQDFGIDVTDVPKVVEMIRHEPTEKISTGIPSLNKMLYGGYGTNEIFVVMAPPGRGKSVFLLNGMYNAMLEQKNVLLVTCELADKAVARRLYSRIGYATRREMQDEEMVGKAASKFFTLANAKGRIIYFPSKTLTVDRLEGLIEQTQLYFDFTPDILIVDYLDELAPKAADFKSENRHKLRNITADLRSIGLRRNIAIVTATQANRASLSKTKITIDNVSESFGKVEVADVVMAICQNEEEFNMKRARLSMLKNRDNIGGGTVELFVDLDRMVMTDVDSAFKMRLLDEVPNVV